MLELLSVAIINFLTQLVKKIPAFNSLTIGWHKTVIRVIVIVFAYVSAVSMQWMTGQTIDLSPVEQALPTVIMFLASQGSFFLFKKKDSQ